MIRHAEVPSPDVAQYQKKLMKPCCLRIVNDALDNVSIFLWYPVMTIYAPAAAEVATPTEIEFLTRMSHELRTPLNAVIGFANVLTKNKAGNLRPQDMLYLQRITDNGCHLLSEKP
jgi:signal transduction histidine kinase